MKTLSCLLVATCALLSPAAPTFADPFEWDLSTIDPEPTAGWSLDLEFDPGGVGHVAYWTPGIGVRYGVRNGSTWTLETLPDPGPPPPWSPEIVDPAGTAPPPDETNLIVHTSVTLALAPDGTPWIAQIKHGLIPYSSDGWIALRHKVGGIWVSEWVTVASGVSIAIDPSGTVHAAWTRTNTAYGRRTGPGAWSIESPAPGIAGAGLILGGDGTVHLAAIDASGNVVYLVRAPGGGWTSTPVAIPTWGVIGPSGFAFDPSGRPAILVSERDPYYPRIHLRLWRRLGETWSAEDVDVDQTLKHGGPLDFDVAGTPLIAYRRVQEGRMVAATPGPAGWSWEAIDEVDTGDLGNDGEFDASGNPWYAIATQGIGVRLATGQRTVGVPDTPQPASTLSLAAPHPSPLPAGNEVSFAVTVAEAGPLDVRIHDARGATVRRESRTVEAGPNRLRLSTQTLAPGIYWLEVVDHAGSTDARRFVITR